MYRALINGRILGTDGAMHRGTVLVHGTTIDAVQDPTAPIPAGATIDDLHDHLLLPGFIDTQVNGGGGVLFNDAPTVEGIAAIGRAHLQFGTTGFLPTLISDDLEVIGRAIEAVNAAIAAGVPGVLGIHIEGPFINPRRKGIHDAQRIRALDADVLPLLQSLRGGKMLLTIAPECTPPELLRALSDAGVILAAGHSEATCEQIEVALKHGLRGFTHLFNAMSPLTSRAPGVVGAALLDRYSWCGIIVDGHHVDPRTLRVALAAKAHERFMLVTDAMPCVGTDLASFDLHGKTIHVRDGYCVDDAGTLAGTALNMARAVRNAVELLNLPTADAVRMASEYPAEFLGLGTSHGRIDAGYRADFVVADNALRVIDVWQDGERRSPN
ncbi:MAG: N-acetylglucosamine-6-phosphate deacetylase [Proteobacteria bacterium]|nr:N-acetylglucosamine-6-phosphate deacetylase [Pseudomonadota bacterium]